MSPTQLEKSHPLSVLLLLTFTATLSGQQVPDLAYTLPLPHPTYESQKGPRVAIDEAHQNFHTVDGRYQPFAELLRRDGYRVSGLNKTFSTEALESVDVLVIVNALHERNTKDWSLPTPSAFPKEEIDAIRTWVEKGGSLLLIADHMPFPGAAHDLAKAFDVTFSNGYARDKHHRSGRADLFKLGKGLKANEMTRGRMAGERVTQVATFGGSAFKPPPNATAILVFGAGAISYETKKAPGITPDSTEVEIEGWCQGAFFERGLGHIVVFGEAAMFSAQRSGSKKRPMGMNAPGAGQNHQLLLNLMHWLSRERTE